MSNYFKVVKDKKEIWADWPEPKIENFSMIDDYDGSVMITGDLYTKAIDAYNSRPHFPVSPEHLDYWKDGEVISEKDFFIHDDGKAYPFDFNIVAIPLPKEPEVKKENDWVARYESLRRTSNLTHSILKLVEEVKASQPEQQDIPMEKDDVINALADLIFTATKLWEDSNKRDGWDTEAVTITHPTIERAKEVLSKFQSPKEEKES